MGRRPRPVGPLARVPQGARDARGGCRRHGPGARSGTTSPTRSASTPRSATRRARPTCSRATSTSATPATTTPRSTRATRGRSPGTGSPRGCTARCRRGSTPSVDASFHGLDGVTYLFKGGRYAVSGETAAQPVAERWGQVRNAFAAAGRDRRRLHRRGRPLRPAGRPDHPLRRLHRERRRAGGRGLPAAPGAALHGPARRVRERPRGRVRRAGRRPGVHLFKDGRTVSPAPGDKIVRRVDKRWGQLGPVLPTGYGRRRVRRPRRQDLPVQRRPVPALHRRGLLAGGRGLPAADRRGLGRDRRAWTPRSCSTARPTCSAPRASCSAFPSRRSSSGPPTCAGSTRATSRPSCGNGCSSTVCASADARVEGTGTEWTVPLDGGARVVVRREADALSVTAVAEHDRAVLRPLLGTVVHAARPRLPAAADRRLVEPPGHVGGRGHASTAWTRCSPAATSGPTCSPATGSSSSTTGAAGGPSRGAWPPTGTASPSTRVDAAFVGNDGKTYVFRRRAVRPVLRRRLHPGGRPVPQGGHELLGQRRQPHHPLRARGRRARPAVAPGGRGRPGADAHLPVLRAPVRPVRGHRLRHRRRRLPARHRHVAGRRAALREPDRRSRERHRRRRGGPAVGVPVHRRALPRGVRSPLPQLRAPRRCAAPAAPSSKTVR